MPSIKELCTSSGLKYGKVRKYIEDIYHDLVLDYEARPVFSFTKVRYEFFIRGRRRRFMDLEADQLPVVPRVGEAVTLPFFSAHLGTVDFFVEEVKHVFEEDMQVVELWLRHGTFNSYWHYRKDKAKEEEELHFMDWLNLEEYELKKNLTLGKGPGPMLPISSDIRNRTYRQSVSIRRFSSDKKRQMQSNLLKGA